jgi:acyl-CoA synthetase (AMP-forming)/AMP-acid ligase II
MADKLSRAAHPADKTAVIFAGSGHRITFGDLERRANQGAHLLRSAGLGNGDVLAICIDNCPGFFDVACAASRSGLTLVPISTKLTATEVAFIVQNSNAKALVVSAGTDTAGDKLAAACPGVAVFSVGFDSPGLRSWDALRITMPATPLADGQPGREMLYSSGTTGRPKGIVYRGAATFSNASESALRFIERIGGSAATRYLSTAPLYHTAPYACWPSAARPLSWSNSTLNNHCASSSSTVSTSRSGCPHISYGCSSFRRNAAAHTTCRLCGWRSMPRHPARWR